MEEATVRVSGYAYVVNGTHVIYQGLSCSCGNSDCLAGAMVVEWVNNGNEKAPTPPPGFTPYLPKSCPVCGGKVTADHSLSSRNRGLGWRCETGPVHYWKTKWETVKGWFFREDIIPDYLTRKDIPDGPPCGRWATLEENQNGRGTRDADGGVV